MEKGVTFLLNEKVRKLESKNSEITGIHNENGYHTADTYVLAAGVWTKNLINNWAVVCLYREEKVIV
jgi:glycine/D-amino acid oxidase-like deaminating enzyme